MELIKIYQGNLVDARELHKFLESKRDFSNWINQRINRYSFKEGVDFTTNLLKSTGGRPSKEYYLTLNMAKELAMVENNDKGKEARRYFIEAEKTLLSLKANKRLEAFTKLETTKGKFKNSIIGLGGTENDYIQTDYKSRKVFFNGEPLEDEVLHQVLMSGRTFAIDMARANIVSNNIDTVQGAEEEAKSAHREVRNTIIKTMNTKPEEIPTEEKVKKLDN